MKLELLRLPIQNEEDIFVVRQRARLVAAELGVDAHDQVRVATALSEVGREALRFEGTGSVVLAVAIGELPVLHVAVTSRHASEWPAVGGIGSSPGFLAARRLMDETSVTVSTRDTWAVNLHKLLPRAHPVTEDDVPLIRSRIRTVAAATPLDELRTQNEQLVDALDRLQVKQDELVRLNEELADTNRGVMAMYSQLSDELEETNRGVVALYAELDEKQLALQEASEAKSRFLASISHELRSPVSSVLAVARLMLDPAGDPLRGEQRHQVDLIATAAGQLLDLVNQLLDLAKAESGRLEPHPVPVSVADLFAELRGTLRPLAPAQLDFDVEEPASALVVETDRALLAQVLRNLITNAIKFTEFGSVRVWARERSSGDEVEIVVRDTGIGIAHDDQRRVFEEFFQVRSGLQVRQRGTGLGLPYSRRVIESLGGTLTLESEVGAGTTVAVSLPCQWASAGSATDSPAEDERPRSPVRVRSALVVDDDPAFRRVLRGMLEGVADEVLEAEDATSGLDLATGAHPDIVFLDLRMPDLHGGEMLGRLAGDARSRDIPVVIVTSVDLDAEEVPKTPGTATVAKATLTRDQILALVARSVEGSRR